MQGLSEDAVLSKLTKITLGIGIFLLAMIFIGLPIPGSPILGEILVFASLIEIARGFLSISKEKTRYKIRYMITGILIIVFNILFIVEFIILFAYVGLGYDVVNVIFNNPTINSVVTGVFLLRILIIIASILILLLTLSFYSLSKDLNENDLSKHSLLLISLIGFFIVFYFTLDTIETVDGYLRPLLFYILGIIYNQSYLSILGIILAALSLYFIILIYNDLAKVVQREFKKKYNLPY